MRDVRAVFGGALADKDQGTQLHQMAQELSVQFDKEWAALMHVLERKEGGGGGARPADGADSAAQRVPLRWREGCSKLLRQLRDHPSAWMLASGDTPAAQVATLPAATPGSAVLGSGRDRPPLPYLSPYRSPYCMPVAPRHRA